MRHALPAASVQELEAALWDVVWRGQVTNDSFAPLRQKMQGVGRRGGRFTCLVMAGGRWSMVADLLSPQATLAEQALARAEVLLGRSGIVSCEVVLSEQPPPGWQAIRQALCAA